MDTSSTISSAANKGDWGKYISLHRAIVRADWDKAHEIISIDKDALSVEIDEGGQTALHVAVEAAVATPQSILFVGNLLKCINPESLVTILDDFKYNPLHRAAIVGYTEAAKMLVEINPHLLFCFDMDYALPIHRAVYNSQKDTFEYLLEACKKYVKISKQDGYHSPFEGATGAMLLTNVINAGYLDNAYELVKDYPHLARTMDKNFAPLEAIARKWDAYRSGERYNFYQSFVYSYVPIKNDDLCDTEKIQDIENQDAYKAKFVEKYKNSYFYSVSQRIYDRFLDVALLHVSHIKHLQEDKVKHNNALRILKFICQEVGKLNKGSDVFQHYGTAFAIAVKNDTFEAVKEILEYFPRAIWVILDYHIFQLAIINRCEKVYNLLVHEVTHCVQIHKVILDKHNNNLLHLAGKLAPIHKLNRVSGAALQMQSEFQWFEAVKKFIRPVDMEGMNKQGETPMMMFRREHKELRKDGEEWMKKTADACTITAALIITIVFAAAITVPGGDDNGKPIYASEPSFIIFAVSDAISLFSSTTSLLLFLSILTARYRDEDFLYSLPKRLILGLATLFLSVTSMMVAFSATLYILFGQGEAWILISIATLTCLPIASFVTLQLPLLVDLISSTYGNGILSGQRSK